MRTCVYTHICVYDTYMYVCMYVCMYDTSLSLSLSLSLAIYIYIHIMSRCYHGSPWPSLAICHNRLMLPGGLQGYILYRHRAVPTGGPALARPCEGVLILLVWEKKQIIQFANSTNKRRKTNSKDEKHTYYLKTIKQYLCLVKRKNTDRIT